MTDVLSPSSSGLAAAGLALQHGRLVAFPTETIYGLGADATSDAAIALLYATKGRPQFNPLIVHVASADEAAALVEVSPWAEKLMLQFWPGPLTLVLPRAEGCAASLLCSAGLDTLAIRCPAHPVARAMIDAAGVPIAAPSANRSGHVSPTTPQHVVDEFAGHDEPSLVLAGGRSPIGLESTVLDLTGDRPVLLRPGAVLASEIEAALDTTVQIGLGDPNRPNAPGQLLSHYAPAARVRLDTRTPAADEAYLAFGPVHQIQAAHMLNLSEQGDLQEAAANLFAHLRALDLPDIKCIAVAPIPEVGLGIAINDRLRRAAAPRDQART